MRLSINEERVAVQLKNAKTKKFKSFTVYDTTIEELYKFLTQSIKLRK
jgi:hypothetical protein